MILALDPGTTQSGWCTFREDTGAVKDSGVLPNADMLALVQLSSSVGVKTLAIEMMRARGMPMSNDAMETLVWIGRFQQAWRDPEAVRRPYRMDIKLHLCGSARAKDPNVWQALKDRLGEPGTKKNPGPLYGVQSHARAALAVAVYTYDKMKGELL
jgi:hypothetical protein